MIEVAPGWSIDATRGPDWLFVRIHAGDSQWGSADGLADAIWNLLRQHFTNRVVLEMDDLQLHAQCADGRVGSLIQASGRKRRVDAIEWLEFVESGRVATDSPRSLFPALRHASGCRDGDPRWRAFVSLSGVPERRSCRSDSWNI